MPDPVTVAYRPCYEREPSAVNICRNRRSARRRRRGTGPAVFVIDGDASIRHFLSLILHGAGIDTEEFADGPALKSALTRHQPDLVFLDIALESADAIACVVALSTSQLSRPRASS